MVVWPNDLAGGGGIHAAAAPAPIPYGPVRCRHGDACVARTGGPPGLGARQSDDGAVGTRSGPDARGGDDHSGGDACRVPAVLSYSRSVCAGGGPPAAADGAAGRRTGAIAGGADLGVLPRL